MIRKQCWYASSGQATAMSTAPAWSEKLLSRNENMIWIQATLPMLNVAEFSGVPLKWPEWSGLFEATVQVANIEFSLKMYHQIFGNCESQRSHSRTRLHWRHVWCCLKQLGCKYWLTTSGGQRSNQVICSFPPNKPFIMIALVNFSKIVSRSVQFLTKMNYNGDLQSDGLLNSGTKM